MILILGAGGFLGINLFDAMKLEGLSPRCGRRRRSNVLALLQRKATLIEADLDVPATLADAMRGCRTVVHLAGHYPRLSTDPAGTLAAGLRQTRSVLEAAAQAGIERLVYVSSTATVASAPTDRASTEQHTFAQAPGFGAYHDLKWHMEHLVTSETRFQTVTLCPGACLGAHDWKMGTSAILWQLLKGHVPPHPEGVLSWVDAVDVGRAIVALITHPSPPSRVLLAAESLDFHGLLVRLAARYGIAHVPPALTAREAVTLADREEALATTERRRPAISREIVDLIVHGPRIDASLATSLFSLQYRSLEQTLSQFEDWARRMGASVPHWRTAS